MHARAVTERLRAGEVPLWEHPEWKQDFPWLVQGLTGAGDRERPFDPAWFGEGRPRDVMERWWSLGRATGATRIEHGHQMHGPVVRLHVSPGTDGHVTRTGRVLLTVTVADCVPVSLVDPELHAVALLHGGWRGVAAGILERGIEVLTERLAVRPEHLHAHLGPAICGECYEVGPEVHRALELPEPDAPEPVDLRAALADRAVRAGIGEERITASTHCTRCGNSPFFSHRRGHLTRQVAVLGIAAE